MRRTLPVGQGQVWKYLQENPSTPSLSVSGPIDMDLMTYGSDPDKQYEIAVEGCFSLNSDRGAQMKLDGVFDSLASDLESDCTPEGALYSRLTDEGEVELGTVPAAQSIGYKEYRGHSRFTLPNGTTVLLATWTFTVLV